MSGSAIAPAPGHAPHAARRNRARVLLLVAALAFALAPAAALHAETAPPAPAAADPSAPVWSAEALDTLTARIALYPDALIAQILPASTFPLQIVEAARWLDAKKSVAEGDTQEWDPSIKALLRYPTVLRMLSQDLRWTDELGQAFVAQPEDVLQAIQRLRRKARALGNLKPTPRQRVIVDPDNVIVIAPPEAEPDIIYVPVYDPMMVFDEPPPPTGMWITFDVGFPLGVWIGTGVSWTSWHVVHGGWGHDWGWGNVYGGCCRGAVYNYTPTVINRRLTTDNRHFWRPRHVGERRRPPQFRSMPSFRTPATPRPTPSDISRGRMPPRTAPAPTTRPDPRIAPRTPGLGIQRKSTTERNAERGRESLRRVPPALRPPAATPARPSPSTLRAPDRHIAPRTPAPGTFQRRMMPSPSFTPRTQPDTQRFNTRGSESRRTMPPPRIQAPTPRIQAPTPRFHQAPTPRTHVPSTPQSTAPPPRREPPKTSAPAPSSKPSAPPQRHR